MRKKKPKVALLGWCGAWECVACGMLTRQATQLNLSQGWLNYRGGRLCPSCVRRFRALPVGAYVDFGHGCKLLKASDRQGV